MAIDFLPLVSLSRELEDHLLEIIERLLKAQEHFRKSARLFREAGTRLREIREQAGPGPEKQPAALCH
jgi:hypothetical protein